MKTKPTPARDYTTGRAARELRVSPSHVRALCQAGMIAARATPGGHFRIPRSEVERLRREGVPQPPPGTPSVSEVESMIVPAAVANPPHRHPVLLADPSKDAIASADEVVRLENEVKAIGLKRTKEENLDWFREREHKQVEAKAARDRQDLEARKQRVRREWENSCLEYALECVPDDAPEELRLPVSKSVREALTQLSPSDPQEVTGPLIVAAVDNALRPWRLSKEREEAVQEARTQLPSWARSTGHSPPSDCEFRAMRAAREAIGQLGADIRFEEMRAAAIAAGRQIAIEYEHQEACKTIVQCVFLTHTPSEQEKARQAVNDALGKLPVGTSRSEMERVRDPVLVPFKAAEESARVQAQAARCADLYLFHVDSYLAKIAADPHSEWELGSLSERHRLAQELKEALRPILIKAILEEPFSLNDAYAFVESLVENRL